MISKEGNLLQLKDRRQYCGMLCEKIAVYQLPRIASFNFYRSKELIRLLSCRCKPAPSKLLLPPKAAKLRYTWEKPTF